MVPSLPNVTPGRRAGRWARLLALALLASPLVVSPEPEVAHEQPSTPTDVRGRPITLTAEQLNAQLAELGADIEQMMAIEMAAIAARAKADPKTGGRSQDINKLEEANKQLSEQTRSLIGQAAAENQGETTRMSWSDAKNGAASLVNRVQDKLETAGGFLSSRLDTLSNFANGVRTSLPSVPNRLLKIIKWPSFATFKMRMNKVYKSLGAALYRQMVFLRTQASVGLQNLRFFLGQRSYLLAATYYADWTPAEYRQFIDNKQAEIAPEMGSTSAGSQAKTWTAQEHEQLRKLASTGVNVFGKQIGAAISKSQQTTRSRRRRRNVNELDYSDSDELNELDDNDEEMMDVDQDDNNGYGYDQEDDSHPMDIDIDDIARAIDEQVSKTASGLDMDDLDAMNDLLDDGLKELEEPFVPVDLRNTECFTKPENQMSCGACYAYTTVAAATYYNCMRTGERPQRLNARFVSDCGRYLFPEGESLIRGCAGGRVSRAVEFASKAGLYEFIAYEVLRAGPNYWTDTCTMPRPNGPGFEELMAPIKVPTFQAAIWTFLKTKEEIDLHLRTVGPVFVNMRIWDGFQDYQGGVVDDSAADGSASLPIHSMLLVGHDVDQLGRHHWIIRNSHGISWGESGHVRITDKRFDELLSYAAGLTIDPNLL